MPDALTTITAPARPLYGTDLTASPAFAEMLAFQAGEISELARSPFEDWCREQAAARRADKDARWAELRKRLTARIAADERCYRRLAGRGESFAAEEISGRLYASRAVLAEMQKLETADA